MEPRQQERQSDFRQIGDELISKKDVLQQTGISYGQFYRWKRMGLIPESWFVRKSTFTGQETFLPRAKILERIARIKSLKDEKSLEEIAEVLSPQLTKRSYTADEVLGSGLASREVLDFYNSVRGAAGPYPFREVIYLLTLEELHRQQRSSEELGLAAGTLLKHALELKDENVDWILYLLQKEFKGFALGARLKACVCVVTSPAAFFDPDSEVAAQVRLNKLLEAIKLKLSLEQ